MGLFKKIKEGLKKTKDAISYKLDKLFTGGVLNDDFFDELETVLISSDIGAESVDIIMEELREAVDAGRIRVTESVKAALRKIIVGILEENEPEEYSYPLVLMIVGVNGVGKTTSIGKLAYQFRNMGKSVTIAAADTFRAAAGEQLAVWADRADVRIIKGADGGDPGAVVFDAVKSAKSRATDVLIIDTAGRLHNKSSLMAELKKMARIVEREYPEADSRNYIVLDATTGQNALSQVDLFDEAVDLDGIIITKLDGTAKGGVLIALAREFDVPVYFIGVGEQIDDLQPFDAKEFVEAII